MIASVRHERPQSDTIEPSTEVLKFRTTAAKAEAYRKAAAEQSRRLANYLSLCVERGHRALTGERNSAADSPGD